MAVQTQALHDMEKAMIGIMASKVEGIERVLSDPWEGTQQSPPHLAGRPVELLAVKECIQETAAAVENPAILTKSRESQVSEVVLYRPAF
jgi:hypothetical protein